ncbi:MAG: methionyl-tRNA formyltransferase [Gammaproteobacteria bacterium]|jgi:methionyl-tRNA formyltransferase
MSSDLKLAFAGTPELAATILQKLLDADGYTITDIYTQPDRPAGRGRKLHKSAVKILCESKHLPLKQPADSSEISLDDGLADADLLIVAAYGMLLPETILNRPRLGCINVHTSLLPRWRGAAPIQRAIQANDTETGISIMQMDAGLDTGNIILQRVCPIAANETAGTLHNKLAMLGGEVLLDALNLIDKGVLQMQVQENNLASYAHKITKAEAEIDWRLPAKTIESTVRAFNPFPVTHTVLNNMHMRVWEVEVLETIRHDLLPGKVIASSTAGVDVTSGDHVIRILKLQLPGKKVVTASDFHNGHPHFCLS